MTAKEYLSRVRLMDIDINQRIAQRDNLLAMSTTIGSFDYSKERVQTSSDGDAPYVKTVEKLADLEDEITAKIDEYADFKATVIDQIQGLDNPNYVRILHMRYIEGKRLEQIAVKLDFSYTHVKRLHGWALLAFQNKYLKDSENSER